MADVFVSYAREDQRRVDRLVELLERQRWSVFWDRDIPPGETWRSHIGAALDQARCVVVAWTEQSILSDWVTEEADEVRERDILVPVLLDPVRPPRGLRGVQAADLTGWPDTADAAVVQAFLDAVASLLRSRADAPTTLPANAPRLPEPNPAAPLAPPGPIVDAAAPGRRTFAISAVAVVLAAALTTYLVWHGGWTDPAAVVPGAVSTDADKDLMGGGAAPDPHRTKVLIVSGKVLAVRGEVQERLGAAPQVGTEN